jgi:AraC-like DNA-binding protein
MINRLKSISIFKDRAFPLACLRHDTHADTGLHRHDFHELVVILAGRGRHVTEIEDYPIGAGDVFLIRGEMAHGYADTQNMTLVNILFDPRRLKLPLAALQDLPGYHVLFRVEPRLRRQGRFRSRLRLEPGDLAEAGTLIARLQDELHETPPGFRFMASTHLMSLIGFLSRCYSQAQHPEVKPLMRFGEVLSYVEENCAGQLTIRELARRAHMSERSLTRMFHRITGLAPMEHVIRVRIARARELLLRGDMRITEAAYECGFNDSNYFSRQFKKVVGMTPRSYRTRGQTAPLNV